MKNKRLIHLYCGEADSVGYVTACCGNSVFLKFIRERRTKYITCKKCLKKCLKMDDKYG